MINVKNLDQDKIKRDTKSFKIFLLTTLDYVWSKTLATQKQIVENLLHLVINKMNGALKKVTAVDICLALICTDESKDTLTKYEELCNKIRDRIRSITKSSSNFGDLLFKKRLKLL